jgi:hypothetical protein
MTKKHKPEEVVAKLRQVERSTETAAWKKRWESARKEYKVDRFRQPATVASALTNSGPNPGIEVSSNAGQRPRDPPLDVSAITQSDDGQIRPFRNECRDTGPRFTVSAPCPADDMVAVAKERPQRRFNVAIPESLPTQNATKCATGHLPHDTCAAKIEPNEQVRALGEQRVHGRVLPLRHPLRRPCKLPDIGLER